MVSVSSVGALLLFEVVTFSLEIMSHGSFLHQALIQGEFLAHGFTQAQVY